MKTKSPRTPLGIGCLTCMLLLIAPPAASLAQQEDDGASRFFQSNNLDLLLISTSIVQNDLEITPSQGELLEALGEDLRSQPGFSPTPSRRGGRGRGRRGRGIPSSDRIIRVLLEKEQYKRLSEVRFQFQGPYAIDNEEFAKQVKLTSEQLEAIREARTNKRVLRHSQFVELIGEEKANAWRDSLGKRVPFRGQLTRYRSEYLDFMQEQSKSRPQ